MGARKTAVPGVLRAILQYRKFERELQEDFFHLAAQSGLPRGLRWVSCEWPGSLCIAADDRTGLISALASVNIEFEAISGGEMEGVAAVSTIRDGSAVFHFRGGCWGSAGRVVFNLEPSRAVQQLLPDAVVVFERSAVS